MVQFRLTPEEAGEIKQLLANGMSQHDAAELCSTSIALVNHIATGTSWSNPKGLNAISTPQLRQIYHDLSTGAVTSAYIAHRYKLGWFV